MRRGRYTGVLLTDRPIDLVQYDDPTTRWLVRQHLLLGDMLVQGEPMFVWTTGAPPAGGASSRSGAMPTIPKSPAGACGKRASSHPPLPRRPSAISFRGGATDRAPCPRQLPLRSPLALRGSCASFRIRGGGTQADDKRGRWGVGVVPCPAERTPVPATDRGYSGPAGRQDVGNLAPYAVRQGRPRT